MIDDASKSYLRRKVRCEMRLELKIIISTFKGNNNYVREA
jgi:hypothetical protein